MRKPTILTSLACLVIAIAALAPDAAAEGPAPVTLRCRYRDGQKYRIITETNEEVLVNGRTSHRSQILNRIAVTTAAVKDGSGRLSCTFQTSETISGPYRSYHLKNDYQASFWRDHLGVYTIDRQYFMPTVRNVPRFIEKAVQPGDSWNGDAWEVHDFRRAYGIAEPFSFPMSVRYTYLRDEVKEGRRLAVIGVQYTTFHKVPPTPGIPGRVPVRITGTSDQVWHWDIDAGRMHSCREEFNFIFLHGDGTTTEFRGLAEGRLIDAEILDRDRMSEEIGRELREGAVEDTAVRKDRDGVTIVLENVSFPPNSAELTPAERAKLDRIAAILKRYPDRDLLITGHTARVGSEETSQILSEQRASTVGDYFIKKGVRSRQRIVTTGKGSRQPLADNGTEPGRRKNRRVEITILEN